MYTHGYFLKRRLYFLTIKYFYTRRRKYKNFGGEVHLYLVLQYPQNLERKRFACNENSSFTGLQNSKIMNIPVLKLGKRFLYQPFPVIKLVQK